MTTAAAQETRVDLLVVGAGPVGLYATYYAGFRGLSVAVIDSLEEPGGQVTASYPEKLIYDVAGFPGIRGADLIAGLTAQANHHEHELILGDTALTLESADADTYRVTTAAGRTIIARAVLIAAGLGSFTPKALPAATGPLGAKVLSFVPSLSAFDGKDVAIVGGGDSAVDWALAAAERAKSVTVIHRRPRFRAHESSVQEMIASDVTVIAPGELVELIGDDDITQIVVDPLDGSGTLSTLDCDLVVAALGFTSNLGPVLDWGVEFEGRHVAVDPTMRTSRERIYAVGDVSEYTGKVRLIAVGFGEAAIAVNHIAADLDPTLQIFPGHSTSNES